MPDQSPIKHSPRLVKKADRVPAKPDTDAEIKRISDLLLTLSKRVRQLAGEKGVETAAK